MPNPILRIGNKRLEAKLAQAFNQAMMGPMVPFPPVLQSLFFDHSKTFANGVDHGCRRRVMVHMWRLPPIRQKPEVEVPRVDGVPTLEPFPRTRRNRDWRQTRRA